MNAAIIQNIQSCVSFEDDLWILGDFTFGQATDSQKFENWFHQIPGRKHLVVGNHDDEAIAMLPWDSICDLKEIKDGEPSLVLYHYPMITWSGARRGVLQLTLSQLDYVSRSSNEHRGILDACYARDTEAAITLTSRHILDAGRSLEQFLVQK